MHSSLRDRYSRRAVLADLLLLLLSLVLNAFVFLDPSILSALRINQDASRIVIGVSSVLVLFLSLVIWRVDWKERAQAHGQAAETLAKLKLDSRALLKEAQPLADRIRQQVEACKWILSNLPTIPEADFARLKARHNRKVRISKVLDDNPGAPVWLIGLRVSWQDTLAYWRSKQNQRSGQADA